MRRVLLLVAGFMTASAVQAVSPMPLCSPTPEERAAGLGDAYSLLWWGQGHVLYTTQAEGGTPALFFLDDCRGARRLRMTLPTMATADAARAAGGRLNVALEDALTAERTHSMTEIAGIARAEGAATELGAVDYASCACNTFGAAN